MSLPDDFNIPPHLIPTAKTLGVQLIERLTSIRGYRPELGTMITLLCTRLGEGDTAAGRELWRLAQGLHYGGVFSSGNLERLRLQLSVLRGSGSGQ